MAASEELHIIFPENNFYPEYERLIKKSFILLSFYSIRFKFNLFAGNLP